jgi:hypothetical protein
MKQQCSRIKSPSQPSAFFPHSSRNPKGDEEKRKLKSFEVGGRIHGYKDKISKLFLLIS